jgi:symplekin
MIAYGGGGAAAGATAAASGRRRMNERNDDDDDNPMVLSDEEDDDNMNAEMDSDNDEASSLGQHAVGAAGTGEDPLLLAIDDLEGRVVSALDDVKLHPGIKTSQDPSSSVHDELATLLRPVLEVAAHTGPSVARTYSTHGPNDWEALEESVEDVYQRIVSDLVLPVVLEMAQSDLSPTKRVAALEFFRGLYKECHKAGSWLDGSGGGAGTSLQAGPYGSGTTSSSSSTAAGLAASASSASLAATPAGKATLKRRQAKRLQREGEVLRYWVEASIACTTPGVFTNEASEGAVASRGIVAASASLRPSLAHIATRIKDADDRGATRLYNPVMKMLDGVLKKLFLSASSSSSSGPPGESIVSACVKFLEIVCLCCSRRPPQEALAAGRRRGGPAGGPGGAGSGAMVRFQA